MRGLEILIEVRPEKRSEFLRAIEWLAQHEKAFHGCEDVTVYEKHGSLNCFLWVEHWLTEETLNARLASEPFQALQGAIQVLGRMTSMSLVDLETKSYSKEKKNDRKNDRKNSG